MNDSFYEASNQRLLARLPADQLRRVLDSECDIDPSFLGFINIYERLAEIIPEHWTVVDLGCAYAPQAFFFDRHKEYVGVNLPGRERFCAPNTTHYSMTIRKFLETEAHRFDRKTTFAICSYVPPWHDDNVGLVRDAFTNVFTYYPAGEHQDLIVLAREPALASTER